MSKAYQAFDSPPPRKLLLHHRLILLASGVNAILGWSFVGMGCFMAGIFLFAFIGLDGQTENGIEWVSMLTLIFPAIGLIFVQQSLKKNFKTVDLLIQGKLTRGKIIDKEATNVSINEQTVFKYKASFKTDMGQEYEAEGRTHHTHLLEDEGGLERILYLPADPTFNTIFDTISNPPEFLPDGRIKPPHPAWILMLVLPAFGISGLLFFLSSLSIIFQNM